jgi:hypothetical protein
MRQSLLDGPIWPQLLRLALPILVVLVVQTGVSVADYPPPTVPALPPARAQPGGILSNFGRSGAR